ALSLLTKTFECDGTVVSGKSAESALLSAVNNTLIVLFEKTISNFEMDANVYSPEEIREITQNLIHEIEIIIHTYIPVVQG
ncbi:MAG: hypothetical protein AABZ43_03000, partial [Planctomycetota bacterium]